LALGDYAGAEALYGEILKKWPDEAYQVTVRRAALARLNGDYQPSLDLLNSLAADTSGDLGMKFYYHRGWTLMKLDRFDEAIADFTKGMNSQPEYAWAYILRACSYASVGQLRYAAGDFDEAAGLFEALPASKASTKLKHDIALAKSTANLLRERADTTVVTPVTGLCDDFWDGSDRSRTRSRFLEAQVTTRD
jgi:tetratricopeptide (TPR) repeat protein